MKRQYQPLDNPGDIRQKTAKANPLDGSLFLACFADKGLYPEMGKGIWHEKGRVVLILQKKHLTETRQW